MSVINNPPLPYLGPIAGGFGPGRLLRVKGEIFPNARCFAINLQTGPNINPRDDVALHLSPVFSPPPRLVRNSIQGQRWGPEESHGSYFPLVAGQQFEIMILCEQQFYKIAINGHHFAEFRHRIPWQSVQFLAIDGEVRVYMLQFEGASQMASVPAPGFIGGGAGAQMPYPTTGGIPAPYPAPGVAGGYPAPGGYPTQSGAGAYPYVAGGMSGPYPTGAQPYPKMASQPYPTGGIQPYPGVASGYPHSTGYYPHSSKMGKAVPIGVGIGAGALAGYALSGHGHRMFKHKKMKFKHKKFFKPKKFKFKHKFKHKHHGFGMFHHHSSSSSSEEEEEEE